MVMALAAVACGTEPAPEGGTMTIQGSVSSRVGVDNARAVAVGTDGRTYWAYLDRDRDFTLVVPVGQSYRVLIANQQPGGGQRTVGHVVVPGPDGRTEWIGANEASVVDFGKLTVANTNGGATKPLCASGCGGSSGGGGGGYGEGDSGDHDEKDDDADDHSDDHECKSGDKKSGGGSGGSKDCSSCGEDEKKDQPKDSDDCDVCTDDADDKELEPSKKPGRACEDKDRDKHGGKDKHYDDKKPCQKKSGGGSGDAKSGGDSGSGSGSGSKKSEGSKCDATSECESVCSCVASTCAKK